MRERGELIQRISVPELDAILGKEFPVLDDGFVRVVDYMGSDASIVQAARVAYGKGTTKISDDENLIRYLFRHAHTSPTEMAEIKLHIRIPMDAWRQFIRHRTANVNEYSTRYSEAIDEKQATAPDAWRLQSGTNKQGSSGSVVTEWPEPAERHHLTWARENSKGPGEYLSQREKNFQDEASRIYQERLKFGVAKEVARKDLPLSTYTEAYWKCDLHNLLHFLSLRMDKHAQLEIRSYANVMGDEIVAKWCPLSWKAFNDYHFRRGALTLTRLEVERLRSRCMDSHNKDAGPFENKREEQEYQDKLKRLGMA